LMSIRLREMGPFSILTAVFSTSIVILLVAVSLSFASGRWVSSLCRLLHSSGLAERSVGLLSVIAVSLPQFIACFLGGIFCSVIWKKQGMVCGIGAGTVFAVCDRLMFYQVATRVPEVGFHAIEVVPPLICVCCALLGTLAGKAILIAVAGVAARDLP